MVLSPGRARVIPRPITAVNTMVNTIRYDAPQVRSTVARTFRAKGAK
jgi:hypothetical protein